MEQIIEIGDKSYTVKELKYKDIAMVSELSKPEVAKSLMMNSTGITEAEYDELSMKDGVKIMNLVNEINGLTEDFQQANQTKG